MAIPAVLLYRGHQAQIGDQLTLNEIWLSWNLRSDLPQKTLPEIGDHPLEENIHVDTTIIGDKLHLLIASSITEDEYIEGKVRGTIYSVLYTSPTNSSDSSEPTQDQGVSVLRINGSISTQAYTSSSGGSLKAYNAVTAAYEDFNSTLPVTYPTINIDTIKRIRGSSPESVIALCATGGQVNSNAMWGIPKGCLLYSGASADPLQEVINYERKINWNITRRYQVRILPTIGADSWQYVFVKGVWVRVCDSNNTPINIYPYGDLPDDLA